MFAPKFEFNSTSLPHPCYTRDYQFQAAEHGTAILALDYEDSPWRRRNVDMRKSHYPLFVYSNSFPLHWATPGDIVVDVPTECPGDMDVREFVANEASEKFLVGFTDGVVQWLTKDEFLQLLKVDDVDAN